MIELIFYMDNFKFSETILPNYVFITIIPSLKFISSISVDCRCATV